MSATLAFNPEADDQRPLAEVKITKLRECPMLTEGQTLWEERFGGSFLRSGWNARATLRCLVPRQSVQNRLTVPQSIPPRAARRWQTKVRDTILELYQENAAFADWVVVLQNLNARLRNTKSEHTLMETSLKAHLESHMCPDLRRKVDYRQIPPGELVDWITEVTELDEELAEERA
ncbi:hypothetical protein C0992_006089 [Termitomyces sp. T32_za158]|nr:hypothetical protein C0992_006089 [Termitomyces sp. T32_za158]